MLIIKRIAVVTVWLCVKLTYTLKSNSILNSSTRKEQCEQTSRLSHIFVEWTGMTDF